MSQLKAVLLLGQYSTHDQKAEYEVRSNLKNFTVEAEEQELYCLQYKVATATSTCRDEPDLASLGSGNTVCALCTSRGVQHR